MRLRGRLNEIKESIQLNWFEISPVEDKVLYFYILESFPQR